LTLPTPLSCSLNMQNIIHIIKTAGHDILLPGFAQQSQSKLKSDGSIVTITDIKCQEFLQQELTKLAPNIGFLGEEMSHAEQLTCLTSKQSFWCVDPLDGTSNFATPMPLFAISIALIEAGKPTLACIYDPVRQEVFTAKQAQGCQFNQQAIPPATTVELNQSVGFVDFKRLNHQLASRSATQKIYRSQRNLGSCALEWAWLAVSRGQFIIHGGEKLWDYAAGSLLAEESGYKVSDFNGQHPFHTSQLSSSIIACPSTSHKHLHSILLT